MLKYYIFQLFFTLLLGSDFMMNFVLKCTDLSYPTYEDINSNPKKVESMNYMFNFGVSFVVTTVDDDKMASYMISLNQIEREYCLKNMERTLIIHNKDGKEIFRSNKILKFYKFSTEQL